MIKRRDDQRVLESRYLVLVLLSSGDCHPYAQNSIVGEGLLLADWPTCGHRRNSSLTQKYRCYFQSYFTLSNPHTWMSCLVSRMPTMSITQVRLKIGFEVGFSEWFYLLSESGPSNLDSNILHTSDISATLHFRSHICTNNFWPTSKLR